MTDLKRFWMGSLGYLVLTVMSYSVFGYAVVWACARCM